MGLVQIDNLTEGMVLAADTHDRNGRLLLTQGTELTSRHIRMFMTWGIPKVDILDHEAPHVQTTVGEEIQPELMQQVESELTRHFRKIDLTHPAMSELFRQCLIRKVRHANS